MNEPTLVVAPAVSRRQDVPAGSRDLSALTDLVRQGSRALNESPDLDAANLARIVTKPWGCECRVFADDYLDAWHLAINPGHGTSMHAHPRKITQLLCLAGEGVTETLDVDFPVRPGTVLKIAAGAFHSTRAVGAEPLHLIEIETPRNKFDLMRLRDDYNRHATQYEQESVEPTGARLRPVPYLPHAQMRSHSPEGRFRFSIRAGMDLFYRPRPADLFHVPLGLTGIVHGDVRVLIADERETHAIATDQYYLSVALSLATS